MRKLITFSSILLALAACGGADQTNPFIKDKTPTEPEIVTDPDTTNDKDPSPTTLTGIFTRSDTSEQTEQNINLLDPLPTQRSVITAGEVTLAEIEKVVSENNLAVERLYLNNIPFDGTETFTYTDLGSAAINQNTVRLFVGATDVTDPQSGSEIDQNEYYALYGKSKSGLSEFVIVKTGNFVEEGFGGHILQSNLYDNDGNMVLFTRPTSEQAKFWGKYDGFRVQTNGVFITPVSGDVEIKFDFSDFNANPYAKFTATNRIAEGVDGKPIYLPDLQSYVQPSDLQEDGQFALDIFSRISVLENYETGKLTGILSGEDASELVAVFTITSSGTGGFYDPAELNEYGTADDTFVETSGIFAYR